MTKERFDVGPWSLDIGHLLVIGIWSLVIQRDTDHSTGMSRVYAILSIAGWTFTFFVAMIVAAFALARRE